MKLNTLENKIRWYLKYIDDKVDIDALELLKMSMFNADGILTFPSVDPISQKQKMIRYWKKLMMECPKSEDKK